MFVIFHKNNVSWAIIIVSMPLNIVCTYSSKSPIVSETQDRTNLLSTVPALVKYGPITSKSLVKSLHKNCCMWIVWATLSSSMVWKISPNVAVSSCLTLRPTKVWLLEFHIKRLMTLTWSNIKIPSFLDKRKNVLGKNEGIGLRKKWLKQGHIVLTMLITIYAYHYYFWDQSNSTL